MPKIPTFTTQARPTAEVAGVKSNLQIPLNQNIGTAFAPIVDAITKHRINEKNLENKAEALSLENESMFQLNEVFDKASKLDNKEQAFNLIQTESKSIQDEFSNRASNKFVQSSFNNSFLGEVQKGISKTNTAVSKNVIDTLDNQVSLKKNRLLNEAYVSKNPTAFALIGAELEDLYEKNYKGRIDNDQYNLLVQSIPGEMDIFELSQKINTNPRQAYSDLMGGKKYMDIPFKIKTGLIEEVKGVLIPEVRDQWKNYIAAAYQGKEIPFDMKFAKEILKTPEYNKILEEQSIAKEIVLNVPILNSVNNKDLSKTLDGFVKKAYADMDFIKAEKVQRGYEKIVDNRIKFMSEDPILFLSQTNANIKRLNEELNAETNIDLKIQKRRALIEMNIQTQKDMGQPESDIKVMSNSMSLGFVKEYNDLGFEGKSKERQLKLKGLEFVYGDLTDKALTQLIAGGLPMGAEAALVLGNEKTFEEFMSFDDPKKIKAIESYLTERDDSDISLKKIRAAISSESDFKDIDNMISRNTPFNNSTTLVKMDQIKQTLSLYAANLMRNNPGMNLASASQRASLLFSNNYQIEDTYYFPKNIEGINQTQRDFTVKKLENIKFNYVKQHFKPVAYKSSIKGKSDIELTTKMNFNIIENGEWRNTPNGDGFVFGIVLTGNSFGTLTNESGKELFVAYTDDSLILPGGSNTVIDMNIPTEQEKRQYRGYYGYNEKRKQEATTFETRQNLDNNEMQNALEKAKSTTLSNLTKKLPNKK